MRLVDDDGGELPRDGKAVGRLQVRGPWVANRYYRAEESALEDGWFDTGDVASIDSEGFMRITDRTKDLIKSGGEWISSIELEDVAMAHPAVAEAAVIANAAREMVRKAAADRVPEGRRVGGRRCLAGLV